MKSCFIVRHWKYYWITFMYFLKSMRNDLRFYLKFYLSLSKRQSSKQTNLQWLNIASWLCLRAECMYWLGRGTGSFWVPKCHALISGYLGMFLYKHPSHCPWILSLCLKTPVLWWKNHMQDLRELHLCPDVSFHPLILSLERGRPGLCCARWSQTRWRLVEGSF